MTSIDTTGRPTAGKELPFSVEEFAGRLARLREGMAAAGLDLLMVHTPENIYYLSGYQTTGYYAYQALLIPLDRPPCFVVRKIERSNIAARSWIEEYVSFEDDENPVTATAQLAADLGYGGRRIGLEKTSWFLTAANAEQLARELPEATLLDGAGLVERLRMVKSAAEIEYLRRAGAITARMVEAGIQAIAPGRSENDLAAAAYVAALAGGSDYMTSPVYVCSGPRSGITHATWEGRVLQPGDPVVFELAANVKRYSAAIMRTAVLAPASDDVRRLAEASRAGCEAALAAMRAGVTSGEVDRACRGAIEAAGFGQYFHHRSGYSIGLGFPPGWGEGHIIDIKANDPRRLEAGMVFHIVPQLIVEGVMSAGISATALVTEDGCERLVEHPGELRVVG